MLKGIDGRVSPELLYRLALMGHGDVLAVVDANYPAYAMGAPVVRMDGVDAVEAIGLILDLVPLDLFVDHPLRYMVGAPGEPVREVTQGVLDVAEKAEGHPVGAEGLGRMDFYEQARRAALIVATSEMRSYGCYLLTKGVWPALAPEHG